MNNLRSQHLGPCTHCIITQRSTSCKKHALGLGTIWPIRWCTVGHGRLTHIIRGCLARRYEHGITECLYHNDTDRIRRILPKRMCASSLGWVRHWYSYLNASRHRSIMTCGTIEHELVVVVHPHTVHLNARNSCRCCHNGILCLQHISWLGSTPPKKNTGCAGMC